MTLAPPHCALRLALGEREACTRGSCQLWHEGECALESVRHELVRTPALSRHLLDLRAALADASTSDDYAQASALFHRRLNEEQATEA
jgi:hypothetical protein